MQLRLRDFLGKKFNEMKKSKNNVFENPRSMAKLLKEAARLKVILSANAEYYAQVCNFSRWNLNPSCARIIIHLEFTG